MFRRAKISVFLILVGGLTASGALLNPEQRHPAFQPGAASLPKAAVLQPAQARVATRLWNGVKVQRITASTPAAIKVELNGVSLAKAGDATVAPGVVKKAGGAR